jgi:hypothetical protein
MALPDPPGGPAFRSVRDVIVAGTTSERVVSLDIEWS